ncbi:MAG: hypothetical protein AAGJ68_11580 [Pseudomonadota bacterium]
MRRIGVTRLSADASLVFNKKANLLRLTSVKLPRLLKMNLINSARQEFERTPINSLGAIAGFISLFLMVLFSFEADHSAQQTSAFVFGNSNSLIWLCLTTAVCYSFAYVIGVLARNKFLSATLVGVIATFGIAFIGAFISSEQISSSASNVDESLARFLSNITMSIWGVCLLLFMGPHLFSGLGELAFSEENDNQREVDDTGMKMSITILIIFAIGSFAGLAGSVEMMIYLMSVN